MIDFKVMDDLFQGNMQSKLGSVSLTIVHGEVKVTNGFPLLQLKFGVLELARDSTTLWEVL